MTINEFTVQWHLTNKCNLNCKHCYMIGKKIYDYPKESAKRFLDDISNTIKLWNTIIPISKSVSFTGGEPLLYDNLFELIRYAKKNDFIVRILTNGTLVNKKIAKKISKHGVNGVQVSIDDLEEEHDEFRGLVGSFNKAINGIRHLVKEGVLVSMSSTLSKNNHTKINKIIELAILNGVSVVRFPRLAPLGNGSELKGRMLSHIELKKVFADILSYREKYKNEIEIIVDDPLFSLLQNSLSENEKPNCHNDFISPGGCSIGFTGICINHDGALFPCRKLPLVIGNSFTDSFREIWTNSEILNNIRDRNELKGQCGNCPHVAACKGCRAVAYSITGDYLETDSQCWYSCFNKHEV